MELFLQKTGTTMLHVPYKGSSPMMADLLGGQVVAAMDAAATSWPQVQAGKLRALGVAGSERAFLLPICRWWANVSVVLMSSPGMV